MTGWITVPLNGQPNRSDTNLRKCFRDVRLEGSGLGRANQTSNSGYKQSAQPKLNNCKSADGVRNPSSSKVGQSAVQHFSYPVSGPEVENGLTCLNSSKKPQISRYDSQPGGPERRHINVPPSDHKLIIYIPNNSLASNKHDLGKDATTLKWVPPSCERQRRSPDGADKHSVATQGSASLNRQQYSLPPAPPTQHGGLTSVLL